MHPSRTWIPIIAVAMAALTACQLVRPPVPVPGTPAGPPPTTAPPAVRQPGAPSVHGCPMLPDDSVFNTRVDDAPTVPRDRSRAMLERFAAVNPGGLRPGASALVWQNSRAGIPLNRDGVPRTLVLDGSYGQPMVAFTATMPQNPRVEGEPGSAWDRHVLVLHTGSCQLDEHINYRWDLLRGWTVSAAVRWDLRSNSATPTPFVQGGFPAEAATMPIAPLVYRYDEVAAGEIRHAIRFTGPMVGSRWVWPAAHSDGQDRSADAVPMGSRLRLRADFDLSRLAPQAKVIAVAMQRYGIVASDTSAMWSLTGEGDPRWNDADLATLGRIRPGDFEVLDPTAWQVAPGSFAARPR